MTTLSEFSDEVAAQLISLPLKAGIWVSHSDDAEGEEDDEFEMKALRHCIRAVAKLHEDDVLVSGIMTACLESEDRWDGWADECLRFPDDAKKAIHAVKATASVKTARRLRAALLEIASAVARAYGEFEGFEDDEAEGVFGKIVGAFAKLSHDDKNHPMNVSASEDSAIAVLAEALKI